MQNDNGLKAYYLDVYKELNKSVTLAKELVKNALPLNKDIGVLIKEINKIRKELDRIFSNPILYQICNECHKQSLGGCCKNKTISYILWRDLIYLISENLEFEFPHPDIEFLTSLNHPACLFLGSKGCLLRERRSIICLEHICLELSLGIKKLIGEEIMTENQVSNLSADLTTKTRLLFVQIMNKNKLQLSGNPLEDYGLTHVLDFNLSIK